MPRYTAAPLAKRRPSATPISLTYEGSLDYVVGVQTVSATPELTAPSKAEVSPPPHKRTRNPPASAPDQCAPPAPSMDIAFLLNATNQPPRPADVCHAQWCNSERAPPSPPPRGLISVAHPRVRRVLAAHSTIKHRGNHLFIDCIDNVNNAPFTFSWTHCVQLPIDPEREQNARSEVTRISAGSFRPDLGHERYGRREQREPARVQIGCTFVTAHKKKGPGTSCTSVSRSAVGHSSLELQDQQLLWRARYLCAHPSNLRKSKELGKRKFVPAGMPRWDSSACNRSGSLI